MRDAAAAAALITILACTSALAVGARWFRPSERLPDMRQWALADQRFGGALTWFLLGGSVFTAYTFVAVPGLVHGIGALGFFALAYTALLAPALFLVLPRLWEVGRRVGAVTVADLVRSRHQSPGLALAVAATGILSTMPYVALQLVGVRAVLSAGGLYPDGLVGDAALIVAFAVLALATSRSGLRAPAMISVVKAVLVFGAGAGLIAAVLHDLGGWGPVFAGAELRLGPSALLLRPDEHSAYVSLALGSVLALPLYPHVLTAAFAASGPDVLRRVTIGLPAWTLLLGLFGLLGFSALALGIEAPPGNAELAVPLLVARELPGALSGAVFGALAVAALVPAAVMSVAVAALFARNVYVEFFAPDATPKTEVRVARITSLLVKVAAVGFVFSLREQTAVNLQLLGSLWIVQTLPTVLSAMTRRRARPSALLTGWAAGMVVGTWLAVDSGFTSVVPVLGVPVAIAVIALAVNIASVAATAAAAPPVRT